MEESMSRKGLDGSRKYHHSLLPRKPFVLLSSEISKEDSAGTVTHTCPIDLPRKRQLP